MKMNRWKLSKIGTPACYRKTGRKVMQANSHELCFWIQGMAMRMG